MTNTIQSVRGMHDYLPKESNLYRYIENRIIDILISYSYNEIRLPIVEKTSLFERAIGKITDVVGKEMYTFSDRKNQNLSLRPEGTAGCIRASIKHGLIRNKEQRFWYIGPMFRYERPQKGRYRQFHQIGVEVIGIQKPEIDAELILLTLRWWKSLSIDKYLSLEINSIGSIESRINYRKILISFLERNKQFLDKNCLQKIYTNPIRILDSKNPEVQNILNKAPIIIDYLDNNSRSYFFNLCKLLDLFGISYTINPKLVRGLDYYNSIVFEWKICNFGSGALCGGGRYDNLTKQLGKNYSIPAAGLAVGLERLFLLIKDSNSINFSSINKIDVYLISIENNTIRSQILILSEELRNSFPFLKLMIDYEGNNLKKQFIRANKNKAKFVLIIGNKEIENKKITIKNLITGKQETLTKNEIFKKISLIFPFKKNK